MAKLNRRTALTAAAALTALPAALPARAASASALTPAPLNSVRLKPSVFLTSVEANQRYLLSLNADRLLHNFHLFAGLPVKGELYGGWEARGIAGHSLGHYQSGLALMYAQTGKPEFKARALYVTQELKATQAVNKDGYTGATTVDRDGKTQDGKVVYEEVRQGKINSNSFGLNGGWVPVYTYHKVMAGLLDSHKYCDDADALTVALGLGDYFAAIIEGLSDEQVQKVLVVEHGGINESYAELYARTGDKRWLTLANRLYHKAVLTPLSEGRDELAGKHANTQIPKLVGLARIHELDGNRDHAKAALFFWETVTKDHSYVIGGNAEYEHFGPARKLSNRMGQQTCECCNSYNMLRLTRHLYGWSGDARYFDFYERAHLNHVLSQQDPETGMFTYFSPLTSGLPRVHSTPFNDFWCCVGSGMESHSKHGESIYWHQKTPAGAQRLKVNLYYPSTLDWADKGIGLEMDTAFPQAETVAIRITKAPKRFELALRVPAWCASASVSINGRAMNTPPKEGYIVLTGLKSGDRIALTLPMLLYAETTPDDDRLVAFLSGPLVLAADLGPDTTDWDGYAPVVIGNSADGLLTRESAPHHFGLNSNASPAGLKLRPYFEQHRNRTAVYFRRYTSEEWAKTEPAYLATEKAKLDIRQRTVDVIRLGEQQPEADHNIDGTPNTISISNLTVRGRSIAKGYFQFDLATAPGPLELHVSYEGGARNKDFNILIDGQLLTRETLPGPKTPEASTRIYALPAALTANKTRIKVRFEARADQWVLVHECRLVKAATA